MAEVVDAIALDCRRRGGATAEPRPATREELARVHDPAYLDLIESTRGRAARLDADTFTSPESLDVVPLRRCDRSGRAPDAILWAKESDYWNIVSWDVGPTKIVAEKAPTHGDRPRNASELEISYRGAAGVVSDPSLAPERKD